MKTPKIKPTTKKKSISAKNTAIIDASDPIINVAGSWKAGVDLTQVRHGKEIGRNAHDIAAAGHNLERHRKAINEQKEIIDDILDELRSHTGSLRELREQAAHTRVVWSINLALIFGLIVAVGYLISR